EGSAGLRLVLLEDHRLGELGLGLGCPVDDALSAVAEFGQGTEGITGDHWAGHWTGHESILLGHTAIRVRSSSKFSRLKSTAWANSISGGGYPRVSKAWNKSPTLPCPAPSGSPIPSVPMSRTASPKKENVVGASC